MEKLPNPVGSDDEDSYSPQAGTQSMHSNPVPPAYSPPITTPPGAMRGPITPMAGPYGPMEGAMHPYMSNIPPSSHSSQQSSTTVIINQMMPTNTGPRIWSSSVCSCCDDMGSFLELRYTSIKQCALKEAVWKKTVSPGRGRVPFE